MALRKMTAFMTAALTALSVCACSGGKARDMATGDTETPAMEESMAAVCNKEDTEDSEDTGMEAYDIPEIAYKMALLHREEKDGKARAVYTIELGEEGFHFGYDMAVKDKKTGETLNYENGYSYDAFEGNICQTDAAHYDISRTEGTYEPFKYDRCTLTFIMEHEGGIPPAEDIELVVSDMGYYMEDTGEHAFTVNAKEEDITVNTSKVLHGGSIVRLKGQLYAMDPATSACGSENFHGWGYTLVPLGGDPIPIKEMEGNFHAVKWNPDTCAFEPATEAGGFRIKTNVYEEYGDLMIAVGTEGKESPEYEAIEGLVPAWADGDEEFVFAWQ